MITLAVPPGRGPMAIPVPEAQAPGPDQLTPAPTDFIVDIFGYY